jgi:hypothetical protein
MTALDSRAREKLTAILKRPHLNATTREAVLTVLTGGSAQAVAG